AGKFLLHVFGHYGAGAVAQGFLQHRLLRLGAVPAIRPKEMLDGVPHCLPRRYPLPPARASRLGLNVNGIHCASFIAGQAAIPVSVQRRRAEGFTLDLVLTGALGQRTAAGAVGDAQTLGFGQYLLEAPPAEFEIDRRRHADDLPTALTVALHLIAELF